MPKKSKGSKKPKASKKPKKKKGSTKTQKKVKVDKTKQLELKEKELDNRLLELESKENELDSRMEMLELKEKELELEISKLKFTMKKRQELIDNNKIVAKPFTQPAPAKPKKKTTKKKKKKLKTEAKIGDERRSLLANQIKSVLKRQEEVKKQEELKKKLLESKKIIDKEKISVVLNDDEKSGAMKLFKLIVDKKSIKLSEAAKMLGQDKKTVKKMAKDLEKEGYISINTPFYGEPKLNLRITPTREISEMFKREYI
ncbi:MAG: hypothetical protein B6U97_03960 [Candidatus Altiarchaeales archaeon ex4484_96]|nr:MAG: hypothetical protein B6U97_03960 [Candidatus Altiarchaeales archaeon ex4484_96]